MDQLEKVELTSIELLEAGKFISIYEKDYLSTYPYFVLHGSLISLCFLGTMISKYYVATMSTQYRW
jgi:hypothetical protein